MRHSTISLLVLPFAIAFTAGCAGDGADDGATPDSANVAVIDVPTSPRIVSIEIGRALDENNRVLGSGVERFPRGDTLVVAIGTSHVPAGTPITVQFSLGDKVLETVELQAAEPAADGTAELITRLPSSAAASVGMHRVEVLLDGTSQGIREISFDG